MRIFIVSDRFLGALQQKAETIFDVSGCRNFNKATTQIAEFRYEELGGLLIVLSEKFDNDKIDDIDGLLYAWQYYTGKLVVYCANAKTTEVIEERIEQFPKIGNVTIIKTTKNFTEEFISENLLSCFSSDEIYKEEIQTDRTSVLNSRIVDEKVEEQDTEEDSLLSVIKGLVEESTHKEVDVNGGIQDYIENPQGFSSQDETYNKALQLKKELEATLNGMEMGSEEYNSLNIQLQMVEMVLFNRANKIDSELVEKYLVEVRESLREQTEVLNLTEIDTSRNDVMELKRQQFEIEEQIRGMFSKSKATIQSFKHTLDVKGMREKIMLLAENQHEEEFLEVMPAVMDLGKESLLCHQSVTQTLGVIVNEWGTSLQGIQNKFGEYTQVRDAIDVKHEEMISTLLKNKNINISVNNTLAQKLIVVTGLQEYCGTSLTGTGIFYTNPNNLFVDLRLDTCTSELYFKTQEVYLLEDAVTESVVRVEEGIKESGTNIILPGGSGILATNREKFFEKILTVLERLADRYTKIVVLVDPKKPESKVILDACVVNVLVSNTNVYQYRHSQEIIRDLCSHRNIKFRYLMFTPCSDEVDAEGEALRLGVDNTYLRIKKIPFMSVDMYKNVGKNIFLERPSVIEYFQI